MEIRELSRDQVISLYETRIQHDFPPDEVKPLAHVLNLLERGVYKTFGLFDDNALVAYLFVAIEKKIGYALIDFLAVAPDRRGKGYGSYFMEHLSELVPGYKGALLEVEDPDMAADADDLKIREARIRLYTRLGARLTNIFSRTNNVDFRILYMPLNEAADDEAVKKALLALYKFALEPKIFAEHTKVEIR